MIRWYALAALVLLLDQASKWVVVQHLKFGESVAVLPFLAWTRACNTGIAFSLFQGVSLGFAVLAGLVSAYLAFEIWRWRGRRIEGAAYGLVLGGALGNLVDRLLHGCVVDFVHVYYGWFNFPVFNAADSAITIGAVLWIGLIVLDSKEKKAAQGQ